MGIYIEKIIWKDVPYYAVYSTFVDAFVSKMYGDPKTLLDSEKNADGPQMFGQKDLENLEINYKYSTEFLKSVENETAFKEGAAKEHLKSQNT